MKRRDLISSIAMTALSADAQKPASAPTDAPPSIYIPKTHLVEDRTFLHDLMDEFPFVDLVTASPAPRITHIPVLLDRSAGEFGTIHGHISKQNEQTAAFDQKQEAVIVFRGPNRYISPAWYQTTPAVPTWNFAVVHATGRLKPITDPKALHAFLARLIRTFESREDGTHYDFSALPQTYVNGMLTGIVGFEMPIERLEGKFKLGQERPEGDRKGILAHLQTAKPGPSLYEMTEAFYKRKI